MLFPDMSAELFFSNFAEIEPLPTQLAYLKTRQIPVFDHLGTNLLRIVHYTKSHTFAVASRMMDFFHMLCNCTGRIPRVISLHILTAVRTLVDTRGKFGNQFSHFTVSWLPIKLLSMGAENVIQEGLFL